MNGYEILYKMIADKYHIEEWEFEDCFVCFDYKYECEDRYDRGDTIMYEDGSCLDDWWEGQTDIVLRYAIPIYKLREAIKEDTSNE